MLMSFVYQRKSNFEVFLFLVFGFILGSAIIIASPVQPVLQGMVGMIPVSVVGQNGNTFSAPQPVRFMN